MTCGGDRIESVTRKRLGARAVEHVRDETAGITRAGPSFWRVRKVSCATDARWYAARKLSRSA
jgi:hypothetical protein